ncbi:MAG: YgaP-like transmembrane domain [Candidatus Geothermarchaeales archaeon]
MKREQGVCNIGPWNRLWRGVAGVLFLFLAVGSVFLLMSTGAPRFYRLGVFFPLFLGSVMVLEATLGWCVLHGWRGTKDMR